MVQIVQHHVISDVRALLFISVKLHLHLTR